jgi:hypothetical protein
LLGLISGIRLTPDVKKSNERMRSSLDSQVSMITEQQAAIMDRLRQQKTLLNLPHDQEVGFVKQYEDIFRVQGEQMGKFRDRVDGGMKVRRIWVCILPGRVCEDVY